MEHFAFSRQLIGPPRDFHHLPASRGAFLLLTSMRPGQCGKVALKSSSYPSTLSCYRHIHNLLAVGTDNYIDYVNCWIVYVHGCKCNMGGSPGAVSEEPVT